MEAALILLCLLLAYAAHALGWIRGWVPASRVAGFWGTLGGDLYEVRQAQTGLEVVSNGKVRPATIGFARRLCLSENENENADAKDCGKLSLDGRTIYWDKKEKWVRQGI
jgi:hypothetical protein